MWKCLLFLQGTSTLAQSSIVIGGHRTKCNWRCSECPSVCALSVSNSALLAFPGDNQQLTVSVVSSSSSNSLEIIRRRWQCVLGIAFSSLPSSDSQSCHFTLRSRRALSYKCSFSFLASRLLSHSPLSTGLSLAPPLLPPLLLTSLISRRRQEKSHLLLCSVHCISLSHSAFCIMSTSAPYGSQLPPIEVFSNATYSQLLRLTGERFTDYYSLLSAKPVSQSLSELGPSLQVLFQHNPHYQFNIGVAVGGAIALTLFRTLFCNLLIRVRDHFSRLPFPGFSLPAYHSPLITCFYSFSTTYTWLSF